MLALGAVQTLPALACAPPARLAVGFPPEQHYHLASPSPYAQELFQEPELGALLGRELSSSCVLPVSIPTQRLAPPCPGQTPPPMPGTLSWPDPCGAGGASRGGQDSCQDAGWEAGEAGARASAGPGLSTASFILFSTFLSCLLWLGVGLGSRDRQDTSTCSLGKGEAIRKASWRR